MGGRRTPTLNEALCAEDNGYMGTTTTTPSRSRSGGSARSTTPSTTLPLAHWSAFEPNDYNPNKMSPRDYAMLVHNIQEFGFVDPVTVRHHPKGKPPFQIIDGENRWRVARDLDTNCPFFDLGVVDDQTARKLTVTLNELRGQYDPKDMGNLLEELLAKESPAKLLESLPFTEEALAGMVGLKDFDWKGLDGPPRTPKPEKQDTQQARWVERTFRLPADVNEVLNEAMAKARDEHDLSDDFAVIEAIAADYLAG